MLSIYYDCETDTLSLWNGRPASEGADVADSLTADFDPEGEVVGFTLEHAVEVLGSVLAESPMDTANALPVATES